MHSRVTETLRQRVNVRKTQPLTGEEVHGRGPRVSRHLLERDKVAQNDRSQH